MTAIAQQDAHMYTSLLYLPSLEDASAEAARKISVAVAKRYIPAKLYCRHDGEFVRVCVRAKCVCVCVCVCVCIF